MSIKRARPSLLEIDPVVFLYPLASLGVILGVTLYWRWRRGFRLILIPLTLGAYFLAIGLKVVVQDLTAVQAAEAFGSISAGFGLYLGLQTVFFEVGLAYVFALVGARKLRLTTSDGVPFGLGLAFWENGVLLGLYPLIQLVIIYVALLGNSSAAASTYFSVVTSHPDYFSAPAQLLPSIFYTGLVERASSLLAHTAWGMLAVWAAVTRRKAYLALALPMGLIDALVPLASLTSVESFEAGVFILGAACLLAAVLVTRPRKGANSVQGVSPGSQPAD